MNDIAIFWHRRDLRSEDNCGLYHSLNSGKNVRPIFIFDRNILERLQQKKDARVQFIHIELSRLKKQYQKYGGDLKVYHGDPIEVWKEICANNRIAKVYFNHDHEPYAKERDKTVSQILKKRGIGVHSYKDQVIFEKAEIVKDDGLPYTVFTPYSKKWKAAIEKSTFKAFPSKGLLNNLEQTDPTDLINLSQLGFEKCEIDVPKREIELEIIENYHLQRDLPSVRGTSRLSVHLRFGTISIRKLAKIGFEMNEKWLNELIWRDFYMMILYHFPHVQGSSFRPKYDRMEWRNNEKEFEAWCKGKTGYPIVDAGMRELNATGFMHNRVRMIVASFLTKHLLIDWRWGEAYFAEKLLDFELSSNNGGWQWAAGCGCDAAPYFRVFNPYLQTKKFDPELKYVSKWVPEHQDPFHYPQPIVEHKFARERAIEVYKKHLNS
ncbi:MAG: deoxyribodipyrimidine photo-lyase [Flavobacteriales bacterium]|nr:deoxyribodipyrimidine photo-lyase [Flavobacteriales bacterium]